MSKYIKLNAAIRILWELCLPLCDYEGGVKQLESLPTIDIVRCYFGTGDSKIWFFRDDLEKARFY